VLALAGAAVLSAAGSAVGLLARPRTRRLIEANRPGAEALDALVERPSRLAGASALWHAITYAAAAGALGRVALELAVEHPTLAIAAGSAIAVVLVFSLGEALPRTLAVHNPERVGLAAAPAALRMTGVLEPVARLLGMGWRWVAGLVAEEPVSDAWLTGDEYRAEPTDEEDAARETTEEAFIEAVVDFAEKIVREVMVPRTDMGCLEDTTTIPEAIAIIGESGYSRLPVYHETLDDIVGVLYAKDLLGCMGEGSCPAAVASIAREAYFVPETKPVDELLLDMRQRKTHIALVADEYGGTAGLVTIEDLLEEIVGEIFDEYDTAEEMVVSLEDGTMLLDARLPIDDFNDLFGTEIELEADSIGGLFVELAGRIPEPGDTVEVEGVRITAREVEGTRVRRLAVEPGANREKEIDDAEAPDPG
jgi:CBS domain containing-hemolysin-like protein